MTLKEVQATNNIHRIPKWVHINKGIMLDYRLIEALKCERDERVMDYVYDFDVYLKKYKMNLQRPYVWKHNQQNEFILSILLEKPIDPVVIVQHNNGAGIKRTETINHVIDGKQRLMTLQKFVRNEFSILVGGEKVYFKDFDEDLYYFFKSRANSLTAIVYYSYPDRMIDDDMKIILFNYYNFAGTPQTEEHKNKLQKLLNQ